MTKSIELKPCPFCGRDAVMVSGWTADGDGYAAVHCKAYFGLSDSCAGMWVERATKGIAEKDVAAMWNRRAENGKD